MTDLVAASMTAHLSLDSFLKLANSAGYLALLILSRLESFDLVR